MRAGAARPGRQRPLHRDDRRRLPPAALIATPPLVSPLAPCTASPPPHDFHPCQPPRRTRVAAGLVLCLRAARVAAARRAGARLSTAGGGPLPGRRHRAALPGPPGRGGLLGREPARA